MHVLYYRHFMIRDSFRKVFIYKEQMNLKYILCPLESSVEPMMPGLMAITETNAEMSFSLSKTKNNNNKKNNHFNQTHTEMNWF